jgi:hypothetical protein
LTFSAKDTASPRWAAKSLRMGKPNRRQPRLEAL